MKMTFNDIFIDSTKKGRKILKENYHSKGKIPIIDQGKNQISGFSDEKMGIYKEIPVIIFGDHTRIIKYVDYPFLLGADGVKILSIKTNKFITKYLYYALLNYYIPDTGYNRHFKWLKNFTINVNSIDEQKRIVIILDKLVTIINKKKNQINLLEELVKSRFIEMFGDPIRNEKGWGVKKLNEIYEIIDGDRGKNYPKSVDYLKEGFCLFLNAKNVTKNGFRFEDTNYISKEKDKNMGKGKLKRGDIVLTTRGTLGNLVIYSNEIKYSHIRINSGMVILRKIYDNIEKRYFIEYLKNSKIIEKIKSGTAQPQIPILHLKKIKIPVPSMALQTQFSTKIEKLEKLKFEAEKSLKEMENLYESLMQKFFKQN